MPQAIAAAASAAVGSSTDVVLSRPSQIEHTTADGTNSAATSRAGRTWRYSASDDRASRPATVPDVESAPRSTHSRATPNGQRRRHHSDRQQSAPKVASTATCPADIGWAVTSPVMLRIDTPSATAPTNAVTSIHQSRAVRARARRQPPGRPPPAPVWER
ncbi:MAG: hypothetical protein R2713_14960 [Ilumatobacteraceae bacterium]